MPHLIVPHAWQQMQPPATPRSARASVHAAPPAMPPQAPLRHCLSEYVRDAECSVDVTIFEAQCWVAPPVQQGARTPPPFITIAFCTSVELAPPEKGAGGGDGGGALLAVQSSLADPCGVAYTSPCPDAVGRFATLSFSGFSAEPLHFPGAGRLLMRARTSLSV